MKKLITLILTTALLAGCGAGRLTVLNPLETSDFVTGVRIQPAQSTIQANAEIMRDFEHELRNQFTKAGIQEGQDLVLSYRFVQLDEGNRFARWFTGGLGNSGEGTMTVEVRYLKPNGQEVAKILAEGKIGSGVLGGGFSNAIEYTAEKITGFTRQFVKTKG